MKKNSFLILKILMSSQNDYSSNPTIFYKKKKKKKKWAMGSNVSPHIGKHSYGYTCIYMRTLKSSSFKVFKKGAF